MKKGDEKVDFLSRLANPAIHQGHKWKHKHGGWRSHDGRFGPRGAFRPHVSIPHSHDDEGGAVNTCPFANQHLQNILSKISTTNG